MKIEELKKIAELSELDFSEQELKEFEREFLAFDSVIERVKTANDFGKKYEIFVKEYAELREDVIKPSSPREDTLKNAPVKDSISFILPKVVD